MSNKDSQEHSLRDAWPLISKIMKAERRDVFVVIVYAILTSLLGLSVPLSSQAIVNAVALGVFSQQLVVLCAIVFLAMLAMAFIAAFELYVVDMIQRRMFVHTAFEVMQRIPRFTHPSLRETYGPELVNRFFDVITIQKSIGKFLLEGMNAVLVLTTGLFVLGIYHPFFLLYDLLFMLFIPVLVFVLGRRAVSTAVNVSKKKYMTASWLEDVARNQLAFKLTHAIPYTLARTESISEAYVISRHQHHRIFVRQILGSYLFKGLATVGILALGGILVIEQSISLGQLVAAEIIIILILGAMEKLISQFDMFYDLVAAVDKLKAIIDQPVERQDGIKVPTNTKGGVVNIRNLHFSYQQRSVLRGVTLNIEAGQNVSLVGASGAGKSTLAQIMLGLEDAAEGSIEVNGVDTRTADLQSLRTRVGYVFPENQIIPASVLENITLGRDLPTEDLQWAIDMAQLHDAILELPRGLHTIVSTSGENISYGMRRKILLARMIVNKPEVLIIDEAFEGIEDGAKLVLIHQLLKWPHWTILNISHDPEVVRCTDHVYVLADGLIAEQGSPAELHKRNGLFAHLFPGSAHFSNSETGSKND